MVPQPALGKAAGNLGKGFGQCNNFFVKNFTSAEGEATRLFMPPSLRTTGLGAHLQVAGWTR
jgi:hypothetical protein